MPCRAPGPGNWVSWRTRPLVRVWLESRQPFLLSEETHTREANPRRTPRVLHARGGKGAPSAQAIVGSGAAPRPHFFRCVLKLALPLWPLPVQPHLHAAVTRQHSRALPATTRTQGSELGVWACARVSRARARRTLDIVALEARRALVHPLARVRLRRAICTEVRDLSRAAARAEAEGTRTGSCFR